MASDSQLAGAVAIFAGATSAMEHAGSVLEKILMAMCIALVSGGGYRLGAYVVARVIDRMKRKNWPPADGLR
jgi:hypothetical protein